MGSQIRQYVTRCSVADSGGAIDMCRHFRIYVYSARPIERTAFT